MKLLLGLSGNARLALLALALGALAVFAEPHAGTRVSVNTHELALLANAEAGRLEVAELGRRIVAGRRDFRLIDLRSGDEYRSYHIPTAENVAVPALLEHDLLRNEQIVVYADTETRAAQAWSLLRVRGYRGVAILTGGLERWKQDVLFPAPERVDDMEAAAAMASFFGGQARAAGSTARAAVPVQLPKVEPPAPTAGRGAKKKKREGC